MVDDGDLRWDGNIVYKGVMNYLIIEGFCVENGFEWEIGGCDVEVEIFSLYWCVVEN